jgi:hypothetical protein
MSIRREGLGHEVVFRSHLPFTFLGPGLSRTHNYEKVAFSQREGLQIIESRMLVNTFCIEDYESYLLCIPSPA